MSKRGRTYAQSSSGRARARPRFSGARGRGKAGPSNLGSAAVGGRRRMNVRTAGFLGVEHKFYDTHLNNAVIVASTNASGGEQTPSATLSLAAPGQGDGASERDGKKILVESIQITGTVSIPGQDGLSQAKQMPAFFIALVQDTQTNAAKANSEDMFKNQAGATYQGTNPLKNLLSGQRFITHKIWKLNAAMGSMASPTVVDDMSINGQVIPFDCFKKLNMQVDFNGGTSPSIANVVNNSLSIVAFTDDNSWAALIRYQARIRFVG